MLESVGAVCVTCRWCGEETKYVQALLCIYERLMLNSHPQLFCSLGSTNPQTPKDRDRLVREKDKCIKMSLRG